MTSTPRAKRHPLYFLSVYDGLSGQFLGQLADISAEGVSLLSEASLRCPHTYRLRILVPRSGRPDLCLEFQAESRWTGKEGDSCSTGFRIPFLTDEQRGQIDQLVQDFSYAKVSEARLPEPGAEGAAGRPGGFRGWVQALFQR